MTQKEKSGFSLVELIVGLSVAMILSIAIYRLVTQTNVRGVRAIQKSKNLIEANKAMDHILSEIQNSFSMPEAEATLLGSKTIFNFDPLNPLASDDLACEPKKISYAPDLSSPFYFVASGIVPLPGHDRADIDNDPANRTLTLAYPDDASFDPVNSDKNDGLRVTYLPVESQPIRVVSNTVITGTPDAQDTIYLDSAGLIQYSAGMIQQQLRVGDYAVIYDHARREFFRVSAVSTTGLPYIKHSRTASFWNLPFKKTFDTRALVQKVKISTYAYEPADKTLYRDTHIRDDQFDPNATVPTLVSPGRDTHWEPVATNLRAFIVNYEVFDDARRTTHKTRQPHAGKAVLVCHNNNPPRPPLNQIGYPLFKNVFVDVSLEPLHPEEKELLTEPMVRMGANDNLRNQPGSNPNSHEGDPFHIDAIPTATPTIGPPPPTIDPSATATPFIGPTPTPFVGSGGL